MAKVFEDATVKIFGGELEDAKKETKKEECNRVTIEKVDNGYIVKKSMDHYEYDMKEKGHFVKEIGDATEYIEKAFKG